ncbi:MAG: TonB family protein [Rhodocyclaceae bacterium]|nr:TonB family protein [Rhodocyclaceae bacterium]
MTDEYGRDAFKRSGWQVPGFPDEYWEVRLLPGKYKVLFAYQTQDPGSYNGMPLFSTEHFAEQVVVKAGMTYFFTARYKENRWINAISTLEIPTIDDTTQGLSEKDGRIAFERLRVQDYLRRQVSLPLDRPLTFVSGKPLDFDEARSILRRAKSGGVVRVRFHVRPDGGVDGLSVLSASPLEVNELFLGTVVTWKFLPINRGGKPAELQLEYSANFGQ